MNEEASNVDYENKLTEEPLPNARPWVRYWARMFDVYLFAVLMGLFIFPFLPESAVQINDTLLGAIIIFLWIFVESLILVNFGTTPGKALLNIKLLNNSGEDIVFTSAFSRSLKVWWRGVGAGIPIVALFTLVKAYQNLEKNHTTTWDRDTGFRVQHGNISWLRITMIIVFFLAFIGLMILGTVGTSPQETQDFAIL